MRDSLESLFLDALAPFGVLDSVGALTTSEGNGLELLLRRAVVDSRKRSSLITSGAPRIFLEILLTVCDNELRASTEDLRLTTSKELRFVPIT